MIRILCYQYNIIPLHKHLSSESGQKKSLQNFYFDFRINILCGPNDLYYFINHTGIVSFILITHRIRYGESTHKKTTTPSQSTIDVIESLQRLRKYFVSGHQINSDPESTNKRKPNMPLIPEKYGCHWVYFIGKPLLYPITHTRRRTHPQKPKPNKSI